MSEQDTNNADQEMDDQTEQPVESGTAVERSSEAELDSADVEKVSEEASNNEVSDLPDDAAEPTSSNSEGESGTADDEAEGGEEALTGPDSEQLQRILEGAILAAGEAVSVDKMLSLFERKERPEKADIKEALEAIQEKNEGRGFQLVEVASGWRFQVAEDTATWVNRLWEEKPQKYSRALLETLALIAYRQPITRGDIEDVRGVAVSSHIIKTLTERDWVKVVGHRDVPGRPALYATTRQFLDYFNLKSLDELPTLGELQDIDGLNENLGFEAAAEVLKTESELDSADAGAPGEGAEASDQEVIPDEEASVEVDAETDANAESGSNPDEPAVNGGTDDEVLVEIEDQASADQESSSEGVDPELSVEEEPLEEEKLSANQESLVDEVPSAGELRSAHEEPSEYEERSLGEEPLTSKEPPAEKEPLVDEPPSNNQNKGSLFADDEYSNSNRDSD